MHIALSKHHEARGGDRAQSRETGDPHNPSLKSSTTTLNIIYSTLSIQVL